MVEQLSLTIEGHDFEPIELNRPPYMLARNGLDQGGVTWRRTTVQSPWTPGHYVTHQVPDVSQGQVEILASGDTVEALAVAVDVLVDAFLQQPFWITETIGGMQRGWKCDCADYWVDSDTRRWRAGFPRATTCRFQFPRYPTQTLGIA